MWLSQLTVLMISSKNQMCPVTFSDFLPELEPKKYNYLFYTNKKIMLYLKLPSKIWSTDDIKEIQRNWVRQKNQAFIFCCLILRTVNGRWKLLHAFNFPCVLFKIVSMSINNLYYMDLKINVMLSLTCVKCVLVIITL